MSDSHIALFEAHRPRLFAIAYRMTGSVMDGEDLVQETYLRWREVDLTSVESPGAYLSSIITRLSINYLKSAKKRREEYVGTWLPEPIEVDSSTPVVDSVELADSLSMAFLLMLERLSPSERAAFLLHTVFDYSYPEIAVMLDKSEAGCRQLVSRGRKHVAAGERRYDVDVRNRSDLVRVFIDACKEGDSQKLVELLAPNITVYADSNGRVVAPRQPIHGRQRVIRFLIGALRKIVPQGLEATFTVINGQQALLNRLEGHLRSVMIFSTHDGSIDAIYLIGNPEKLRSLSIPA